MLSRISFLVCVAAALALAGCGRRGPLEPPPGAPPDPPAAQAEIKAPRSGAPGSLFRNTTAKDEDPADKTADAPARKKPSSFVLDPLL